MKKRQERAEMDGWVGERIVGSALAAEAVGGPPTAPFGGICDLYGLRFKLVGGEWQWGL